MIYNSLITLRLCGFPFAGIRVVSQGVLTGKALYKHHAYTRLNYLAQSINYSKLSAL
jgi:hypothetical protein